MAVMTARAAHRPAISKSGKFSGSRKHRRKGIDEKNHLDRYFAPSLAVSGRDHTSRKIPHQLSPTRDFRSVQQPPDQKWFNITRMDQRHVSKLQ
jgi:hypothetical protein